MATEHSGLCMVDSNRVINKLVESQNFSSIATASTQFIWAGKRSKGEVFSYDIINRKVTSIKETVGLNGDAIIAIEVDSFWFHLDINQSKSYYLQS